MLATLSFLWSFPCQGCRLHHVFLNVGLSAGALFLITGHHSTPFTKLIPSYSLGLQLHPQFLKNASLTASLRDGPTFVFSKCLILPLESTFHTSWWRPMYYRLCEGRRGLSLTHCSNTSPSYCAVTSLAPNECSLNKGWNERPRMHSLVDPGSKCQHKYKVNTTKMIRLWHILSGKTWRN